MSLPEIKLKLSEEDYAFLRFQGVKHNMSIPGVVKKLIKDAKENQKKTIDLSDR